MSLQLKGSVQQVIVKNTGMLKATSVKLQTRIKDLLINEGHRLEILEKKNSYLDPFLILKRGYSITYYHGKAVKNASQINVDDIIETKLAEGILRSKTI
jgi:exodeoxyribonuclease VII large subunit